MGPGFTQPLTEMSTKNLPDVKARPALKTASPSEGWLSKRRWIHDVSRPYSRPQPVTETGVLFTWALIFSCCFYRKGRGQNSRLVHSKWRRQIRCTQERVAMFFSILQSLSQRRIWSALETACVLLRNNSYSPHIAVNLSSRRKLSMGVRELGILFCMNCQVP
jgi:hypothetical protein